MDCSRCRCSWNNSSTVPLVLSCGHSLCRSCCSNGITDHGITCGKCSRNTSFPIVRDIQWSDSKYYEECINTLLRNETLIEVIAQLPRNSYRSRRAFNVGDECEEHKKPIHSHTKKPFSMLCDDCLADIRGLDIEVFPYPEVVRLTKSTLESAMKKFESNITFLSQQFNHIRESALDPNEREVRQKLEDHFNIIKSGIDQAHQTTRNTLAKLVAEEERQHKAIRDTAESSLNEIDAKERRIQFMMSLSDAELVEQYSEIERLVQESRRPITNYIKPERTIDVNINPNLDTFTQLIKDSYRVSFNPQTRQEWSCENCGRSNRIGVHQCETCRLPFSGGPQIPRTN
jgi:hypothetical protein